MGTYIDRIIEVLDDNNVWKAVVLPRNEMGEKEESIVFGYLSDRNYDMVLDGTLVKSAKEIAEERLADATRDYVSAQKHQGSVYCVSLTAMKLQVELCIERYYSQLTDSFHGRNYQMIIKALAGEKQQESRYMEDEIDANPRMEYDAIMEDMQNIVWEISKIETLASYFGGVDDTDRIRVVFFDS